MTPEAIASELRAELMAGTLSPGAELSQVMLADRFGVSRIPIRDALRILAGEGLIEMAHRGAKVIALRPAEVREIYDLRVLLECDVLRRAARNMTSTALEEIERVRRKSDLDAGTPDWAAGDWAFHRAIYVLGDRPRQLAMIESLRRTCQMFVSAYSTMPAKKPRWLDDHRRLVEHLRRKAVDEAVLTLQEHLEGAARHLLERMTAQRT
ncbi:GntR family transcriptional regulator [Pendulispora brunnea]|uniref:GntR family transcriptional regulator n=1 Tax=Pendulispora brunnea TaxID=2905690 RepID=A0ABZ2JUN2_9BACT